MCLDARLVNCMARNAQNRMSQLQKMFKKREKLSYTTYKRYSSRHTWKKARRKNFEFTYFLKRIHISSKFPLHFQKKFHNLENFYCPLRLSTWLWNLEFAPEIWNPKNFWIIFAFATWWLGSIRHFSLIFRISGSYFRTFDAHSRPSWNQANFYSHCPIKIRNFYKKSSKIP